MRFHEATAAQIAEFDRDQSVVVIPIAATEQHGPHMPTGTDGILCGAVAEEVERMLPECVLLAPTLWFGASSHHLPFGATFDISLPSYIETLRELGRSVLADGFQRLFFLNGHGGNIDPMRVVARCLHDDYPKALIAAGCYWDGADQLLDSELQGEPRYVGHACEFETSMMMHLRPELVRQDQIRQADSLIPGQLDGIDIARDMKQRTSCGYTGRPDLASAEKGMKLMDGIVMRLKAIIEDLLRQPRGSTYQEIQSGQAS